MNLTATPYRRINVGRVSSGLTIMSSWRCAKPLLQSLRVTAQLRLDTFGYSRAHNMLRISNIDALMCRWLLSPVLQTLHAEHYTTANQQPADDHTTGRIVGLGEPGECDAAGSNGDSEKKHGDRFHQVFLQR
jgi:hypothetical protein